MHLLWIPVYYCYGLPSFRVACWVASSYYCHRTTSCCHSIDVPVRGLGVSVQETCSLVNWDRHDLFIAEYELDEFGILVSFIVQVSVVEFISIDGWLRYLTYHWLEVNASVFDWGNHIIAVGYRWKRLFLGEHDHFRRECHDTIGAFLAQYLLYLFIPAVIHFPWKRMFVTILR